MKVLLDSSDLISAFLTPERAPGELVRAGLDNRFEICRSLEILEETARVLRNKPGLRDRYRYSDKEVNRYVEDLAIAVTVVNELPSIDHVCRDPCDDHVLAAAVAVGADVIVTGDLDLLELDTYRGLRILAVRAFLEQL